jgi:hypothetical protein
MERYSDNRISVFNLSTARVDFHEASKASHQDTYFPAAIDSDVNRNPYFHGNIHAHANVNRYTNGDSNVQ